MYYVIATTAAAKLLNINIFIHKHLFLYERQREQTFYYFFIELLRNSLNVFIRGQSQNNIIFFLQNFIKHNKLIIFIHCEQPHTI